MSTRTRTRAGSGVAGLLALGLSGCSGFFVPQTTTTPTNPTSPATASFVYVANGINTVAGFAVGTTTAGVGQLTAVAGSPISLNFAPSAMAVTPNNGFLYVAIQSGIYVYSIASATGTLTVANAGGAVAVTVVPAASLDVSPDGQWLFALSGDGQTLTEYQINATTGALSVKNAVSYAALNGATPLPRMVKVSPNGAYVCLALGTGGDAVFSFTTATGVLGTTYQQLGTGSATTSDNALTVDSGGSYLYIARSGATSGVAIYDFAANGSLPATANAVVATGAGPFAVLLDSTGKYLYAANRTDGTISGFAVGASGGLTALGGSPYGSGTGVSFLARESSGKYLFAGAAGGSPDLTMYSFDATVAGKLDQVLTAATGTDPTSPVAVAATH